MKMAAVMRRVVTGHDGNGRAAVVAILSDKGELIALARTNLRRQWEIRVGGAPLLLSRLQLLFGN